MAGFSHKNQPTTLLLTLFILLVLTPSSQVSAQLQDIVVNPPQVTNGGTALQIIYEVFVDTAGLYNITQLTIQLLPLQSQSTNQYTIADSAPLYSPSGGNSTNTFTYTLPSDVYGGQWSITFTEIYIIKSTMVQQTVKQGVIISFPLLSTSNSKSSSTPTPTPTPKPSDPNAPQTFVSTISPQKTYVVTSTDASGAIYINTVVSPPIVQTVIVTPNTAPTTSQSNNYSFKPASSMGSIRVASWWEVWFAEFGIFGYISLLILSGLMLRQ